MHFTYSLTMESKEIQKIIPFEDLWENLEKLEQRLINVSSSDNEYLSSISPVSNISLNFF